MLPVAYRVIKGFATFFGVIGILTCIGGIIGGIIANEGLKKNQKPGVAVAQVSQVATVGVVPEAVQGALGQQVPAHQDHHKL